MRRIAILLAGLLALLAAGPAAAKLRVGASTNDLGSIAASVGGDQVEVFSISRPSSDPHRVEVLPSYMVQVSRANHYLKIGMGLDQWADGIIDGSRNTKLTVVDCSKGINALEKPGQVSAALGDIHPFGNPHYWTDPRNGAIVATTIADAFGRLDPAHADDYRARAAAFGKDAAAAYAKDRAIVATMPVKRIFTYHRSWPYLGDAFGLDIAETVEPLPGIPPTAKHLQDLVRIAKESKVPVLLQEPYFSEDAGKFLARATGIRLVKASAACDDTRPGSYLAHIESVLQHLADAAAGK
jgi:zinc/manganese transport system substrate-binding protein